MADKQLFARAITEGRLRAVSKTSTKTIIDLRRATTDTQDGFTKYGDGYGVAYVVDGEATITATNGRFALVEGTVFVEGNVDGFVIPVDEDEYVVAGRAWRCYDVPVIVYPTTMTVTKEVTDTGETIAILSDIRVDGAEIEGDDDFVERITGKAVWTQGGTEHMVDVDVSRMEGSKAVSVWIENGVSGPLAVFGSDVYVIVGGIARPFIDVDPFVWA